VARPIELEDYLSSMAFRHFVVCLVVVAVVVALQDVEAADGFGLVAIAVESGWVVVILSPVISFIISLLE
jgi:hypothetical protein